MSKLIPGTQVVVYAGKEASYGTPARIAGTWAFRTMTERLTPGDERLNRDDRSGSADYLEQVAGRKSADWEITKLVLPYGTQGASPDDTFLWEAALGTVSLSATQAVYRQAAAHDTSLTLRRGVRGDTGAAGHFQEHVEGAIVNRMEISWGTQGNNGQAQVTFAGPGQVWGYTGNSSLNSAAAIATDTTAITVTNAKQFTVGSVVCIAKTGSTADAGSNGQGILLTAVNTATNLLTTATTLAATHTKGDAIYPYNPTSTTAGSPIHARLGRLSLDGGTSNVRHLGGRLTYEDNRRLLNDEVGQEEASAVLREERRDVTFSMEYMLRTADVPQLLGAMYLNEADDMLVEMGDATGSILQLQMANVKYDVVPVDIGQEMARITMTGRAYGTSGNDSVVVKFR